MPCAHAVEACPPAESSTVSSARYFKIHVGESCPAGSSKIDSLTECNAARVATEDVTYGHCLGGAQDGENCIVGQAGCTGGTCEGVFFVCTVNGAAADCGGNPCKTAAECGTVQDATWGPIGSTHGECSALGVCRIPTGADNTCTPAAAGGSLDTGGTCARQCVGGTEDGTVCVGAGVCSDGVTTTEYDCIKRICASGEDCSSTGYCRKFCYVQGVLQPGWSCGEDAHCNGGVCGGDACSVAVCGANHDETCWDHNSCINAGTCSVTACGANSDEACLDEVGCVGAGGVWTGGVWGPIQFCAAATVAGRLSTCGANNEVCANQVDCEAETDPQGVWMTAVSLTCPDAAGTWTDTGTNECPDACYLGGNHMEACSVDADCGDECFHNGAFTGIACDNSNPCAAGFCWEAKCAPAVCSSVGWCADRLACGSDTACSFHEAGSTCGPRSFSDPWSHGGCIIESMLDDRFEYGNLYQYVSKWNPTAVTLWFNTDNNRQDCEVGTSKWGLNAGCICKEDPPTKAPTLSPTTLLTSCSVGTDCTNVDPAVPHCHHHRCVVCGADHNCAGSDTCDQDCGDVGNGQATCTSVGTCSPPPLTSCSTNTDCTNVDAGVPLCHHGTCVVCGASFQCAGDGTCDQDCGDVGNGQATCTSVGTCTASPWIVHEDYTCVLPAEYWGGISGQTFESCQQECIDREKYDGEVCYGVQFQGADGATADCYRQKDDRSDWAGTHGGSTGTGSATSNRICAWRTTTRECSFNHDAPRACSGSSSNYEQGGKCNNGLPSSLSGDAGAAGLCLVNSDCTSGACTGMGTYTWQECMDLCCANPVGNKGNGRTCKGMHSYNWDDNAALATAANGRDGTAAGSGNCWVYYEEPSYGSSTGGNACSKVCLPQGTVSNTPSLCCSGSTNLGECT